MDIAVKSDFHQVVTQLLEKLGNKKPTHKETSLAESLLLSASIGHKLVFHSKLTSREIGCFLLAAKGKTIKETAILLKVKPSTVETWRKTIKRKLSSRSIAHAVFEGIRFGYIKPQTEEKE